jgi:hypothetical protein
MNARPLPDWAGGLLLAGLFFLVGLVFSYREAVVEPDSVCVAFGIVQAISTGEGLGTRDLYGLTFSFGYYLLFLTLYPHLFTVRRAHIV